MYWHYRTVSICDLGSVLLTIQIAFVHYNSVCMKEDFSVQYLLFPNTGSFVTAHINSCRVDLNIPLRIQEIYALY